VFESNSYDNYSILYLCIYVGTKLNRTRNSSTHSESEDISEPGEKSYKTLHNIFLKADFTIEQRDKFLNALEPSKYNDGDVIVKQGDIGDRFYIIAQGKVSVKTAENSGGILLLLYMKVNTMRVSPPTSSQSMQRSIYTRVITSVKSLS
jgi:hypothetical protein